MASASWDWMAEEEDDDDTTERRMPAGRQAVKSGGTARRVRSDAPGAASASRAEVHARLRLRELLLRRLLRPGQRDRDADQERERHGHERRVLEREDGLLVL